MKTKNQPPFDEPTMVSYGECECLAYLDKDGTWRNWYSDNEIKNVREWTVLE